MELFHRKTFRTITRESCGGSAPKEMTIYGVAERLEQLMLSTIQCDVDVIAYIDYRMSILRKSKIIKYK